MYVCYSTSPKFFMILLLVYRENDPEVVIMMNVSLDLS